VLPFCIYLVEVGSGRADRVTVPNVSAAKPPFDLGEPSLKQLVDVIHWSNLRISR
jgi:hypothetical protein